MKKGGKTNTHKILTVYGLGIRVWGVGFSI